MKILLMLLSILANSNIAYGMTINQALSENLFLHALIMLNDKKEKLSFIESAILREEIGEQVGPVALLFIDREGNQASMSSYELMAKAYREMGEDNYKHAIETLKLGKETSNEFSFQLGYLYLQKNKYDLSLKEFSECAGKKARGEWPLRVRTLCKIGMARTYFEMGNFDESDRIYRTLDKRDYFWPSTLWENAWNSFHKGDFNRVLGLVVTYNSSLFQDFYVPEASYLSALSYVNLCLYDDAEVKVNHFLEKVRPAFEKLNSSKINFTELDEATLQSQFNPNELGIINSIYLRLERSPYYHHLKKVVKQINREKDSNISKKITRELNQVLTLLEKEKARLFKNELSSLANEAEKLAYEFTNLKLTILADRKELIYDDKALILERARGSYANVNRSKNQYFWSFNGEFWADELGDYSFGLKSNCEIVSQEVAYENR